MRAIDLPEMMHYKFIVNKFGAKALTLFDYLLKSILSSVI
jgi:hypothetical protein